MLPIEPAYKAKNATKRPMRPDAETKSFAAPLSVDSEPEAEDVRELLGESESLELPESELSSLPEPLVGLATVLVGEAR